MLYRRGWPTSVVLLLLMVIPQLALPLGGRYSPLGLHHVFRLVRAARGLLPLRGIEVLQVRTRVRATGVTKIGHRMRTGAGGGRGASF